MSERRKITRREFLYVSTLATAGAIATACGGTATPAAEEEPEVEAPEATQAPAASGSKYKEASNWLHWWPRVPCRRSTSDCRLSHSSSVRAFVFGKRTSTGRSAAIVRVLMRS